ncbi:hypothetical protein HMI56_005550, partial [Coelomomyces lativittatus]
MNVPALYDNTETEENACTFLELCHFNLTHFSNLSNHAPTLRTLVILAQDLHDISMIPECKLLENLWVCETKVSDISPLRSITTLKNLHLYSNSIKDISGLEKLENLESLWLNDNEIRDITPLFSLSNLNHLNLANNQISQIDPSVSNLSSLITLNLAGNLLCSIDAFKNLAGLKNLRSAILEHAFYGSNPICLLQNYELLFICYCDNLTQLNEKIVHQDIVQQANELLYQKTKHFEIVWQTKVAQYLKDVRMAHEAITQLSHPLVYLMAFLDWNEITRPSNTPHPASAFYNQHVQQIQALDQRIKKDLYNQLVLEQSKLKISFFYLGNVTFVDEVPDHAHHEWFANIPDFYAQSHFIFVRYPFPYPQAPFEWVPLNDDLHLLVASKLPCAFCLNQPNVITDLPKAPQFVSSDYDAYKTHCMTNWNTLIGNAQSSHLVSIELVHMGLVTLPSSLCLPNVTRANLSFNALTDLSLVFLVFPKIVSLKIIYNCISKLPDTYPSPFQSIDLSGNRLSIESYPIFLSWESQLAEFIYDDYLVERPVRLMKDYFLFSEVTNLILDDAQLQKVELLSTLSHVHVLSLRNNQLKNIDGLAQLTHLEKLFLGGNALTNIDALSSLQQLQVLDCSCNLIQSIHFSGSRPFPKLIHFNINGNQIDSLETFKQFPSLQELYLAYNKVQDPKELNALAHLPLLVLDLTDNPLHFAYYRAYLIYLIPMLQFLDGVTVTDEELSHAKSLLVGCLTREKLLECMHVQRIPMLTYLDLRACQLMKLDCFRPGEFNALAFVNLDQNQFSEVHNLIHLRGLRCLSLNGNKLESLPESTTMESTLWPFLTELFLDQNHISKLSDLHLSNSCELHLLSLRGNRISRLDGLEHYQM